MFFLTKKSFLHKSINFKKNDKISISYEISNDFLKKH